MTKPTAILDIECFADYFLAKFLHVEKGTMRSYDMWPGKGLNSDQIRLILREFRVVTFNGNQYDIPMLTFAMSGASCAELKAASDWIIVGDNPGWMVYDKFEIPRLSHLDHVDLIEVAPGDGSLKQYGGRLHSRRLQDLPIDPSASVAPEMRPVIDLYCGNDLLTTADLLRYLEPQIALREQMSDQYGVDLRSKSDAQIAEAVIRKEVAERLQKQVSKPVVAEGTVFRYQPPEFLMFKTEQMHLRLLDIAHADFIVQANGSPKDPPALDGTKVLIGRGVYRMGIGGLHSSEEHVAHVADEETVLMDIDVTSYYPSIILRCGLKPEHMGDAFTEVYRSIFDRRVKAKKAGNKVVDSTLKIVLNGSFGKFGSKYSAIYAPDLMIQVTVTGQLALLMLIEAFELDGIEVVSANTDGIVVKAPRRRLESVRCHIRDWEVTTGFRMEETHYRAIYCRDVNNYVALKEKGGLKGKGAFADFGIAKNPVCQISVDAVKALLEHGTPIAETIIGCRDVRRFVTVRRVNGGAMFQGKPIGKVVRWVYRRGATDALHYVKPNKSGHHNKVPNSEGCEPLMELPAEFPDCIDYDRYINKANEILKDIGALR